MATREETIQKVTNVNSIEAENDAQEESFPFRIPLLRSYHQPQHSDPINQPPPAMPESLLDAPSSMIEQFQREGFYVFPEVLWPKDVHALNDRLEDVLRGQYDRNGTPDKLPKKIKTPKPPIQTLDGEEKKSENGDEEDTPTNATLKKKKRKKGGGVGPIGFSGNYQNVKVLQIINIHKADSLYRRLETNPQLAHLVAQLAQWPKGARLAQDQIWAKPPGAPPLVFHRDSPYFMFDPNDVVTVWIALDDMLEELGPLEYVVGSHKWGDGRVGSASQFFQSSNVHNLLQSAASCEGLTMNDLTIVSMKGMRAGSLSIHHGKIWHGSNKNQSKTKPRRGLGLHFVPANVRFTQEAKQSKLWKPYVEGVVDPSIVELSQEDFPNSQW